MTFTAPGDGNLHVDIAYASLPASTDPALPTQVPEFVEIRGLPAHSDDAEPLRHHRHLPRRPDQSRAWTLSSISGGFNAVGSVTAVPSAFGIELSLPLLTLGFPWTHRYAVNAGSAGETIPEHPDLAPNSGLFDAGG